MVTFSDNLDRTFSALAHPTRRAILARLARDGSASVSDLAEPFAVSLMAISKQLKVLEVAGLIRREKDGRIQRCSYDPRNLEAARDWIDVHRQYWEEQLDSLAAYLEDAPAGDASTEDGQGSRRDAAPPQPKGESG